MIVKMRIVTVGTSAAIAAAESISVGKLWRRVRRNESKNAHVVDKHRKTVARIWHTKWFFSLGQFVHGAIRRTF